MIAYLTNSLARPSDVSPDAPRGFAFGVALAFVLVIVLPCIAMVFALTWAMQDLNYMPPFLVKLVSFGLSGVLLVASVPVTMRVFWQMLKAE